MRRLTACAVLVFGLAASAGAFSQNANVHSDFDLMILLDKSGSVSGSQNALVLEGEWRAEIELAQKLAQSFSYGPADVMGAVGAYGTTAAIFNDLSTAGSDVLLPLSSRPNSLLVGTGSCQTCAFELATAQFQSHGRIANPNVTILFTDGANNVRTDEFLSALTALQATSALFVLGIGPDAGPSVIDPIASDVVGIQTSFFVSSFGFSADAVRDAIVLNIALYAESLAAPIPHQVPEPATLSLLALALARLGFSRRKRVDS